MKEVWSTVKDIVVRVAEDTVSMKKRERNAERFDEECEETIKRKNEKRLIMLQRQTRQHIEAYWEGRRTANSLLTRKKKSYIKAQIENVQDLTDQSETKEFYFSVKQMTKGFQSRAITYKDNDGNVVEEEPKILERWVKHFEELLNGGCEQDLQDTEWQPIYHTAEPHIQEPTLEEVVRKY